MVIFFKIRHFLLAVSCSLLVLSSTILCFGQQAMELHITDNDSLQSQVKNRSSPFYFKGVFPNARTQTKELNQYILNLQENGFLALSLDSIIQDSTNTKAYIHAGKKYTWAWLKKGNVDEAILNLSGYREKIYRNKPFSLSQVRKLQEKILRYCENNGYPFAAVRLDSIRINNDQFQASLRLDKNALIKIDSLIIKGSAKITPVYLESYLSIKPGDVYNESPIEKLETRLRELPFITETRAAAILFTDKNARIFLYLDDKKANQFDGVVGFLPKQDNSATVITGEAKLRLLSSFGRGELIDLNWRKIDNNVQDLKARLNYPFLFSSPFGADLFLSLYKKDTSFVDLVRTLGLQYLLPGGNYFKIFVNNKESSLLSTAGLESTLSLPPYADVSATIYGLGLKKEKLDYRLNPRRGFSVEMNAGAGKKHIQKNNKIPAYLYENIQTDVSQYNMDLALETYIQLSDRMVLNLGVKSAHLISPTVFQNELYRIGGLRTLRGFDEESIFASSYTILKAEYRYIMERNAFLFAFLNGAQYENNALNKRIQDTPYGYGAGITFETKLGIFSVTYALGKQFDNPVYFKAAKIHFGIVNYF